MNRWRWGIAAVLAMLTVGFVGIIGCGGETVVSRVARPDEEDLFDLQITPGDRGSGADGEPIPIQVRLAISSPQRRQGLKYINHLPRNNGMLFLFSTPHGPDRPGSLTMEDCKVPLTVAFLRKDGTIVQLTKMDLRPAPDDYVCRKSHWYWLEMKQGFYDQNGIEVGDRVLLGEEVPAIADAWAE